MLIDATTLRRAIEASRRCSDDGTVWLHFRPSELAVPSVLWVVGGGPEVVLAVKVEHDDGWSCPADVPVPGPAVAKALDGAKGPVSLSVEQDTVALSISTCAVRVHISQADGTGFSPESMSGERPSGYEAPPAALAEAWRLVGFSVGTDKSRSNLSGVHVSPAADALVWTTTDGHRLSMCRTPVLGSSKWRDGGALVTRSWLRAASSLGDFGDRAEVWLQGERVVAECGSAVLAGRILDERFPDFKRAIPADSDTDLVVPPDAVPSLVAAVERAALVGGGVRAVELSVGDDGTLELASGDERLGSTLREPVGPSPWAHGSKVKVNLGYIGQALDAAGDGAAVSVARTSGAVSVRSARGFWLIMPMRD